MKHISILIAYLCLFSCSSSNDFDAVETKNLGAIFNRSEDVSINFNNSSLNQYYFGEVQLNSNVNQMNWKFMNPEKNCAGQMTITDKVSGHLKNLIQNVNFCTRTHGVCLLIGQLNYISIMETKTKTFASLYEDSSYECYDAFNCSKSDYLSIEGIISRLIEDNSNQCVDQSRKFEIDETKKYFILSLTGVTMAPASEDYKAIHQLITSAENQNIIQSVKPIAQLFEGGFYHCIEAQDFNQRKELLNELTQVKTSVQQSYYSIKSVDSCN